MAIHPDSSFPLLVSDQAEVISIYLQLRHERDLAESPAESSASEAIAPWNRFRDSRSPRELPDHE